MLPLSPLAFTVSGGSVNASSMRPLSVSTSTTAARQIGADDAAVVAVDVDRAGQVGQLDRAVVGVDHDVAVDVADLDAVVVGVDLDVEVARHLDAVRHAAPHRTDQRARPVQLERRVDDLVAEPGIAQSFGDLGLDADLVGVGPDDRHRASVVVDEQAGESGRPAR